METFNRLTTPEVADIFRINEKEFFSIFENSLTRPEVKAYYAIRNCRTEILGGHIDKCNHCGLEKNSYNTIAIGIVLSVSF